MKRRQGFREAARMRRSFAGAWYQSGARHVPEFSEILARYAEPGRVYHTVEHVLDCLRWLAANEEPAERLFRAGRERILMPLLEASSIYRTPFFSRRLEAQARTKLSRALRALRIADHEEEH